MQELETLLNTLIKMGWKPRYKNKVAIISIRADELRLLEESWSIYTPYSPRLRELVSLESWLWQFVVENRMVKENDDVRIKNYQWDNECDTNCCYDDYEYRLIESALIPEEKLGKFLVDNIAINE